MFYFAQNHINRRNFFKKVLLFLFGLHTFLKANSNKKTAVIYLTRTNNTEVVAQMLHYQVGGDLIELQTKIPYPKNYKKIVEQVRNENDKDFLPEIVDIKEFDKYEKIFLGFPTWGMQLPPPMKRLLDKYNFSNKTIIPFNTNAGYGIGDSFETIKRMAPTANILDGFSVKGAIERDGIYFVMKGDYKDQVNTKLISWINNIKNKYNTIKG